MLQKFLQELLHSFFFQKIVQGSIWAFSLEIAQKITPEVFFFRSSFKKYPARIIT